MVFVMLYVYINVIDFENNINIDSVNENENVFCIYCNSLYSHSKSNEHWI